MTVWGQGGGQPDSAWHFLHREGRGEACYYTVLLCCLRKQNLYHLPQSIVEVANLWDHVEISCKMTLMTIFQLTDIAPEALIHRGVGAEAGWELPGLSPRPGPLLSLLSLRPLRDWPQVVDPREVSPWQPGSHESSFLAQSLSQLIKHP